MQIDIRAPFISTNRKIWRLFPGDSYGFLKDFLAQQVGYLDFPAFQMPPVGVSLSESSDLIQRIAATQRAREILLREGRDANASLDLRFFIQAKNTQNRGRLRRSIIDLLETAKSADLVILPEPIYAGNAWIGQFIGNDVTEGYFPSRYGKTTIPSRRIKWHGPFAENTISTGLSQSLRQSHPFTRVENSHYAEILGLAYGSFQFESRFASTVYNSSDFKDTDSAFIAFVNRMSAAACRASDAGVPGLGAGSLISVLLTDPPEQYASFQAIDIHSAGFHRFISHSVVALVTSALIATFLYLGDFSSRDTVEADVAKLTYVNSGANADPFCTARVSEAAKRVLSTLDIDETWKLCQAARAAKARTGLRSTARPGSAKQAN